MKSIILYHFPFQFRLFGYEQQSLSPLGLWRSIKGQTKYKTLIPFILLPLMASTSSNNCVVLDENDDDNEEEEEDVDVENEDGVSHNLELELRLGTGSELKPRSRDPLHRQHFSGSSAASSTSSLQGGLGLGFHNGSVGGGSVAVPANYHDHHRPSSSWPWHVGSGPSGTHVQCGDLHLQLPRTLDYHRRTETVGVWFTLRSAPNREGEMLPQLPRAYIRVKDENVTVLIVKRYLVTKLGLLSVAEIDISCMGQPLLHSLTLKYVRDFIWRPILVESLSAIASRNAANETSLNHLMPLHYAKHCL